MHKQLLSPLPWSSGNGKEATKRKAKWENDRISWYSHVEKLNHEEAFEKTYRMPLKAFDKLV